MQDYKKLVKALRCKRDDCEGCDLAFFDKDEGWMCQYVCTTNEAAAAIEELQAETVRLWPKRGKWINSKERMRPDMCSVCGCAYEADRFMNKIVWNYCPNCGAKMEETNADRFD